MILESVTPLLVSFNRILEAAQCLEGVANKTPVMTSRTFNQKTGSSIYFKCENFQRIGAFKFRGAYFALSQLPNEAKSRGVITYSSGNHAQAIALASRLLDIPATIVMPEDAPAVKLNATRGYGANVVLYDKHKTTRELLAGQIATEKGLTIIPPYDHPDVIAGQGTAALELLRETGDLDVLLVCCGGGGLLSGSSISTKHLSPSCKVIGIEPAMADDATRSFYSGILQKVHNPDTIADGARTPFLGKHTFPIILQLVDQMLTVPEENIIQAMRFVWERMKIVIEPTSALPVAALLMHPELFRDQKIGIILSGGNVDLASVGQFF